MVFAGDRQVGAISCQPDKRIGTPSQLATACKGFTGVLPSFAEQAFFFVLGDESFCHWKVWNERESPTDT